MKHGNRIAELRNKKGWTQEELALRVGVKRATISHYEQTLREPDYETLVKIAEVLGSTVDYLVGQDNNLYSLEVTDADTLRLAIDGLKLSSDEIKRFVAFVRAERSMNSIS